MTTNIKKRKQASDRIPLVKATLSKGRTIDIPSVVEFITCSEDKQANGAITPPYDASKAYALLEQSSWLRPCIDAYVTNIDSFGHHFVPSIDLSTEEEANIRIKDTIFYERVLAGQEGKVAADKVVDPTPEEIQDRREKLKRIARLEYARLRAFFSYVCPQFSFVELRRRTRQDLEVCGNAYWEITRNGMNELANFYYVRPQNVRLLPEGDEDVKATEYVKVTDITWMKTARQRRFRRYIITRNQGSPIYFKEFGDPRIMSRVTGEYYSSLEEMQTEEKNTLFPATELVHFSIFSPAAEYGIPRWIANLPAVLGSRELDEVNYNYFTNNVVPPLALLCSGGRFGKGVAQKIEEYIDEHLKGKKGIHRILVLEAEGQKSAGDSGPRQIPKIQFVPLRDTQLQDALFQEYDKRNEEKIAQSFRLPRILRGNDSAINRATAFAALKFAEEQVFEPERQLFDEFINRHVMPQLSITFWLFRSNSPIVRDPETTADMLEKLVKAGILLPGEARQIAADIFNRAFIEVSEDWSNKPLPLLLAQLKGGDLTSLEVAPPKIAPQEVAPASQNAVEAERQIPRMPKPAGTPLSPLGGNTDETTGTGVDL